MTTEIPVMRDPNVERGTVYYSPSGMTTWTVALGPGSAVRLPATIWVSAADPRSDDEIRALVKGWGFTQ